MSGGRTDGRMSGGRTDGWVADGRTDIINSCETCFPSHIRVLSKRIKRGYGIENASRAIPSHIRVLSKRIKRGYGIENASRAIPSHIRVLSFWIKCGYDLENTFHKNLWYPSVRHSSVRPYPRFILTQFKAHKCSHKQTYINSDAQRLSWPYFLWFINSAQNRLKTHIKLLIARECILCHCAKF